MRPTAAPGPEPGSSPPTRGARNREFSRMSFIRIIPAYAGSTRSLQSVELLAWDHPRLRGEHEWRYVDDSDELGSSPPTRGAPPTAPATPCGCWDHPRLRGEHTEDYSDGRGANGSSPPTRGARVQRHEPLSIARIIPAYAGSTHAARTSSAAARDHPRLRGEHMVWDRDHVRAWGSSPPTRGAPPRHPRPVRPRRIIPAYAGSTFLADRGPSTCGDHPRLRGEHGWCRRFGGFPVGSSPPTRGAPMNRNAAARCSGSSPPTRGAHYLLQVHLRFGGIIPAYAGSTSAASFLACSKTDHPRLRGEHTGRSAMDVACSGSSPPTRGARGLGHGRAETQRIIPAYAGSTAPWLLTSQLNSDHPRLRGEHLHQQVLEAESGGSSPPTRGARHLEPSADRVCGIIPAYAGSTVAAFLRWWLGGIIPAYAGSTSWLSRGSMRLEDHPRLRGEHVLPDGRQAAVPGSSPPTRGAPPARRGRGRRRGIIPAYAGSTIERRSSVFGEVDHPRLRGEHSDSDGVTVVAEGSSPPTRGARPRHGVGGVGVGIIPAYAGSTSDPSSRTISSWDHPRLRGEHCP